MILKRLQLLGYKTFAERHDFLFDGGITAIVGPNGSGKSNIADAVRWALGEQSFSLLRAKKSEDMIFSGSERRAPMGMAEVTITLDNAQNWLPVEFNEVAITRRSYRSGENQYFLNGSRVRLRDISDLLGKSSLAQRTYTVIGQGLIDTALSLRPYERRKLIEEAAGLTLYQSKRLEAFDKLEETKLNVLRVHDLIAEIEPRLRRLKHQAERAEEVAQIQRELDDMLRIWYSYQWKRGHDELRRLDAIAQHQREHLNSRRAHVQALGERIAQIRSRQGELRRQVGEWHRESSTLHTESEVKQRDLAVGEERRRLLIQRHDELLSELAPLQASRDAQQEQVDAVQSELSLLGETLKQQQAQLEIAQEALEAHQAETSNLQSAQAASQGHLIALRAQIADRENRIAQLDERQQELQESLEAHQSACTLLAERLRTLESDLTTLEAALRQVEAAVREMARQREDCAQRIASAEQRQQAMVQRRYELDQHLGRLKERYDLLTRMRDEGAGLYEGVRRVLQAGSPHAAGTRKAELRGILGTVAELIHVRQELETALEVALGGQLQDVVVESWQDAQAAIDYLKRVQGGRATFLPLDTLRPAQPLRAPAIRGVTGVASELITYEPRLRPIAQYLLGRTIVCQDLEVARGLLDTLRGAFQIVTPAGEVVRSSGAVTGGTRRGQRQGSMLARERERRDLPARLSALGEQRRSLEEEMATLEAEAGKLRDEVSALAAHQVELEAERDSREQERTQVQQHIQQAEREQEWYRSLRDGSDRELGQVGQRKRELRQHLVELQAEVKVTEQRLAELRLQMEQMDSQDLETRLAECRADVALTLQQQASRDAELRGYRQSLAQTESQIAARGRQIQELTAQLAQTESQVVELREQEVTLSFEIQAYAERIEPAELELTELESQLAQTESEEGPARARFQALESRYTQTHSQVSRQQDRMDSLRRQIENDLGLVDLDLGDDLLGQPPLPLAPLVSSLPQVEALPEGHEEQIRALRRRLNRLGPVNPDAPTEYAEVLERHCFLSAQAEDLERGAAHLREVLAELDKVMQREFRRTFDAVSKEFRAYFSQLFNGGSARLQLTEPDDLMNTGIDIVARPPGKRQQGLALLSGGERALTAAALIFGILTVSPTPFCVLDEVDATLDEANVGRFRAVLKSLSQRTQFVVITHNRYTIEAADIVYGISMGADGTSSVISQRMNRPNDKA